MYLIVILLLAFVQANVIRPVSSTLQCYGGFVGSNGHSLANWTCDHTTTHLMPVVQPDGNLTYAEVNYSLHNEPKERYADINYCVIFKHDDKTDYHCDYNYICSKYLASTMDSKTIQGVTIKGMQGTLHCCNSDLCNDQAVGVSLVVADSPKRCYSGTATDYTVQQCQGSDWCIRSIVQHHDSSIKVTPYSCDNRNLCHAYSISNGQCHNVTDHETSEVRTVCCCASDLCNSEGLATGPATISVFTFPVHDLSTLPSHLLPGHAKTMKHWMYVGGIVASVMFGLLVFIVVAVTIKRYKERRDAELIYSYTQLSADLADDRVTDDEQMIVA